MTLSDRKETTKRKAGNDTFASASSKKKQKCSVQNQFVFINDSHIYIDQNDFVQLDNYFVSVRRKTHQSIS